MGGKIANLVGRCLWSTLGVREWAIAFLQPLGHPTGRDAIWAQLLLLDPIKAFERQAFVHDNT
jgi:hypothetical protein